MMKFSRSFGLVLRMTRLKKGYSQERLAEKAGLDRTFVSMIERGRRRPTLETAKKLADAMQVSLSSLIATAERKKATE